MTDRINSKFCGINNNNVWDDKVCSTRSSIVCKNGAVACSQPIASNIGLDIMKYHNGNAADAAIAIAAALAVLEPCSTGLGGDMFCLYYNGSTKDISCINGSGKSPNNLSYDMVYKECGNDTNIFMNSSLSITVPGAAMGWENVYNKYGSKNISFADLLEPAAKLAENGFLVGPITSYLWKKDFYMIKRWYDNNQYQSKDNDDKDDDDSNPFDETPNIENKNNNDNKTNMKNKYQGKYPLTNDDNLPPEPGDLITNLDMANVLRELGKNGAINGFYNSWIGDEIVAATQKYGGCLSKDDLLKHIDSIYPEPISSQYRDVTLWQIPPNGQGISSLIALTGLEYLETRTTDPITALSPTNIGTSDHYHVLIEMMRLGFADTRQHIGDIDYMKILCHELLNIERISKRIDELYNPNLASIHGMPDASTCTVSFQVIDKDSNAISFVNSNFWGFGTGIVPNKCGFTLQNRGAGFNLLSPILNHPNSIGPNKRPYHTIIPGIITHTNQNHELYATISNMGGNMQPQGHLQLLVNMIAGGMDPQQAIDYPRFCITDGTQHGVVYMEEGISSETINDLKNIKKHHMISNINSYERTCIFGRAQIIYRNPKTGVLWAGSDGRADGCAMGY